MPAKFLKPFRSVRFNIGLFLVIALASAIGTFFPQPKPTPEALAKLGEFWVGFFELLGFFDVYHTWWFKGLLALIAFDVLVCKLDRLPPNILGSLRKGKKDNGVVSEVLLRQASLKKEFGLKKGVVATGQGVVRFFNSNKMKFVELKGESPRKTKTPVLAFSGGKHPLQKWGDFILHVSIVVILMGGLIGAMYGFEEFLPIMEGTSYTMKNRPFEVKLDDFEIQYYQSTGAPSQYASELVVLNQGKIIGYTETLS